MVGFVDLHGHVDCFSLKLSSKSDPKKMSCHTNNQKKRAWARKVSGMITRLSLGIKDHR